MSTSISGMSGAISSALQGLNSSIANFNQDAQAIAGSVGGGDATDALVDAGQQNIVAEANANVLSMSDKMLGSLLDVTA